MIQRIDPNLPIRSTATGEQLTAFPLLPYRAGVIALGMMTCMKKGLDLLAEGFPPRAMVELAARTRLPAKRVLFHAFTDGRDTPPRSADGYRSGGPSSTVNERRFLRRRGTSGP